MQKLLKTLEIRDPVHNYISLTEAEKRVIDTRTFQRLRNIKQLAAAYLVYPGAEHTRFGHSLGTLHLAGKLAEHLSNKGFISKEEVKLIRLSGLLHDIGHGPFSHVFEEAVENIIKKNHEDFTVWLIEKSEVGDILKDEGFEPKEIINFFKRGDFKTQIVRGPVDSDKMDFLVRDSYFTGVEYGKIDVHRLIYGMEIVKNELAIDYGCLYALEAFLLARFEMFKAVYYHKTVRSAELMLANAISLAADYLNIRDVKEPEDYIKMDDVYVISKLRGIRKEEAGKNEKLRKALEIYRKFELRDLLKVAYEKVIQTKNELIAKILTRSGVREGIESEIAEKAGVDKDFVIIDTPTLPSVPYMPRDESLAEVSIVNTKNGRAKRLGGMSEFSSLLDILKGYLDVLRIYTVKEHRERVSKAAENILGEPFLSQKVSY